MNDVSENVIEETGKEPWEPFLVIETTDAFKEPYTIWDTWKNCLAIEDDGTVPTFQTSQEAQVYCLKIRYDKRKMISPNHS